MSKLRLGTLLQPGDFICHSGKGGLLFAVVARITEMSIPLHGDVEVFIKATYTMFRSADTVVTIKKITLRRADILPLTGLVFQNFPAYGLPFIIAEQPKQQQVNAGWQDLIAQHKQNAV